MTCYLSVVMFITATIFFNNNHLAATQLTNQSKIISEERPLQNLSYIFDNSNSKEKISDGLGELYILLSVVYYKNRNQELANKFWEKGNEILPNDFITDSLGIPISCGKVSDFFDEPKIIQITVFSKLLKNYRQKKQLYKKHLNQEIFLPFLNSSEAKYFFSEAERFFMSNKLDSAIIFYKKANDIFREIKDWENVIICSRKIGLNIFLLDDFSKTLIHILKAGEIGKEKYSENHIESIKSYNLLGWAYYIHGYFNNAIKFWERGLKLLSNTKSKSNSEAGYLYSNLGIVYDQKGDHGIAKKYYNKALPILLRSYKISTLFDVKAISGIYIGHILRSKSDHSNALKYLKNVEENSKNLYGAENIFLGVLHLILGQTFLDQDNYKQALENFNASAEIIQRTGTTKSYFLSLVYKNMGKVYSRIGNFELALSYFTKALSLTETFLSKYNTENTVYYNLIGQTLEKQGRYIKAIEYYEKAVNGYLNNFSVSTRYKLSHDYLLEPISKKAKLLTSHFDDEIDRTNYMKQAYKTYQLGLNVIEKIRRSFKAESSKLLLAEKASNIYIGGIKTLLNLYSLTSDKKYKAAIFSFIEKNKAGVLLELLTESNAKHFSGIPDSLLKKEKNLRIDLAFNDTELNKEKQKKDNTDSTRIRIFEDKLFDLNIAYQELLYRFETEYSEYFNLKYKNDVLSVEDIQKRLNDNEILLEYFIGDSSLFIFTIDKHNYDIVSCALPKKSTIKELSNSIYNIDTDKYLKSSYSLYMKLIKPVEEKLKGKQILLIPDGILHYVPFESLLTKDVKGKDKIDYSLLPYLINDHDIRYAYSATMAFNKITNSNQKLGNKKASSGGFIGFAPVFADSTIKVDLFRKKVAVESTFCKDNYRSLKSSSADKDGMFCPLPASEEEVTNIYKMFEQNNKHAEIYLHSNATEQVIKSEKLNKFNYVHLATHAFMNENNPKLSGIVLTTDSAKIEDGVLYSEEIYNLNLNANLVVLSACESGLGEIVKGEGIIGFTRGLIFSGAKNIIVSLWNVLDRSTTKLMTSLYDKILTGKSYSRALRQSKLEIIKEKQYSPPRYWAPFILVGN